MAKRKVVSITTEGKEREAILLQIDGEDFEFRSPKQWAYIKAMVSGDEIDAGALVDWIRSGFSDEDWQKVEARLEDGADPFDLTDLTSIVHKIVGEVAERPPTS